MIEILEWDSKFFGFETARFIPSDSLEMFKKIIKECQKKNVCLLYVFLDPNYTDIILHAKQKKYFLADVKVTYSKKLSEGHREIDENIHRITFSDYKSYREDLYFLAILSGQYSRFKLDDNISRSKFEKMYKLWIDGTIMGQTDGQILTYNHDGKILGMVTLTFQGRNSKIGLISVRENFQGKSIGRKLMKAAEYAVIEQGNNVLDVATQKHNYGACKFYNSLDYKIIREELIYHIWLT